MSEAQRSNTTTNLPRVFLISFPLVLGAVIFLFTPYPYISLILTISIVGLAISKNRLSVLFYSIILIIPFYRVRTLSEAYPFLKLDHMLALLLILILAFNIIFAKRFPNELKGGVWKYLGLFFLVNLISTILSPYPDAAFDGLYTLFIAYVFIALNLICIKDRDFIFILPTVLAVAISVSAAISAVGYIFKIPALTSAIDQGLRAEGPTSGANNMALMCIFAFPIIMHYILESESVHRRLLYMLMLAVTLFGLVSTFSRGGFINALIIFTATLIQKRSKISVRNFGIAIGLLLFSVIVGVTMLPDEFIMRQKTLERGVRADTSTQRRAAYLKVGIESVKEHPIFGTGTLTFPQVWVRSTEAKRFRLEPRPAHNTYMDTLVGSGLIGLISFVALLVYCYRSFSESQRIALEKGERRLSLLIGSYKLSYLSIIIYFFAKSATEHKLFLLSIALSEIAKRIVSNVTIENDSVES